MMSRLALWLALQIVRAVAMLVPAASRVDWTREWDAELRHRAGYFRRRQTLTWRTNMHLISRAFGSLSDAAWIRRQFTIDADAVHDAVHAVRMLLKAPAFTAIVLLVFAIGIGTTTAMVSLTDVLFFRPLAVSQPERVMTIWQNNRDTGTSQEDVAPANAIDWLARARSFESIAMAEPWTINATIPGREPDYLEAARVSEQFFTVLGTPMLHGRPFLPQEYRQGSGRSAILSYPIWRDRFGANRSMVGQAVRLDPGDAYTIVGVLPPGFELRLFDNRATRPETAVWLPKPGFAEVERNLRGYGILECARPTAARRLARGGQSRVRHDFDAACARVPTDQQEYRGTGVAVAHASRREPSSAAAVAPGRGSDSPDRGVR
jgi:MacB-like protein